MPNQNPTKTYSCQFCEATFTRWTILRGHLHSHLGVKPYRCNMCEAEFARQSDRKRHMNSHAKKTFPCERCGKPFTRNSNMKKHAQFCEAPISDQTPVSNEDQGDRVNRRGSEKECNADPGSSRRELSWAFISALITNPNQCCIERLRKNAMAIANSADCRRNVDYIDLNPLIRYLEAVNDDNAWALGLKLIEGMVKAEGLRLLRVEKGHCSQADLLPLIRDLEEDDTQNWENLIGYVQKVDDEEIHDVGFMTIDTLLPNSEWFMD